MSTRSLTSHRLLRLCRLLCTACSSMLSVRRISWRSLYMFGFANRPSSAEKCDSSSSGDNWMPQIGHELWPVADAPPTCIGFFGPIPGMGGNETKKIVTHQLIFLPPLFGLSRTSRNRRKHNYFFINFRPLNMKFFDIARSTKRKKKSRTN